VSQGARVRTGACDPRIARLAPTSFLAFAASVRFVEALRARLARRQGPEASARRILRVARRRHFVGHTHIRVDPRFELRVGTRGDRVLTSGERLLTLLVRRDSPRLCPPAFSKRLALRLVSRAERVTGVPQPGPHIPLEPAPVGSALGLESGLAPVVRTVQRVVLQPYAAVGDQRQGATKDAERGASFSGSAAKAASAMQPAAVIDGVEVERLTNQVIAAIDRRIVAERERLGRI
jgi:hypothetical protein